MPVEGITEVLAPAVIPENFDGSAMLLRQCLCLESLICAESLRFGFGVQYIRGRVAGNIGGECDEVASPALAGEGRGSPGVAVHLFAKALRLRADTSLQAWVAGCARKDTHVALRLL